MAVEEQEEVRILRRFSRRLSNYTSLMLLLVLCTFVAILLYLFVYFDNWRSYGALRQYQWNNEQAVMEYCFDVGDCAPMPAHLRRQSISLYYQRICPIVTDVQIKPNFELQPGQSVPDDLKQFLNDS